MSNASNQFGACPCGGGRYEERWVEVRMTVDGEVVILTDIPQGVCGNCGSRVYKAGVLEVVEAIMNRRDRPPVPSRDQRSIRATG
jgi:YgiT-type zinc finger domain-containing protein